jgi:hypothetical protein
MRGRAVSTMVAAALFAPVLVACGGSGEALDRDAPVSASDATAPAGPATTAPLEVPSADGTWQQAGDLCRIVTPDIVRQALDYDGAIEQQGAFNPQWLPADKGMDACDYVDQAGNGYAVLVGVFAADDSVWAATRSEVADLDPRTYRLEGGAEVIVTSDQQALVYEDGFMASALNSSAGKFDPAGLARLAALALSVVATK